MKEKISGHTFEFFWDDGRQRQLTEDSRDALRGAIQNKYVKGKLDQWENGRLNTCSWKDLGGFTDEDLAMCIFSDWMRG